MKILNRIITFVTTVFVIIYLAVYKTAYNNAKDIYTWTSSMTGYRASNIFPNDAVFAHKGSSLINDEVIIYREEQLTIQYLIELQI